MRIASMAGIKIFVTGGIGGVHRNANETMDVSADLTEMEQTSVAVVSAGIKSILDIGLTLEYLETKGIPGCYVGQNEFPSFYSRKSGFSSPLRLDDVDEIANMLHAKWQMGLNGAVLIANPLPPDQEIVAEEMEVHIQKALNAAKEKKISGKEVTPFLLQYISEHTKGESLEANIALIKNNARNGSGVSSSPGQKVIFKFLQQSPVVQVHVHLVKQLYQLVILKIILTEGAPAGEKVFSSTFLSARGDEPLRPICMKPSRCVIHYKYFSFTRAETKLT
jgi:pseudouridine-5'-phosphate glycosidase